MLSAGTQLASEVQMIFIHERQVDAAMQILDAVIQRARQSNA